MYVVFLRTLNENEMREREKGTVLVARDKLLSCVIKEIIVNNLNSEFV